MPKKILDEVTREQVKAILMQHLEQKGAKFSGICPLWDKKEGNIYQYAVFLSRPIVERTLRPSPDFIGYTRQLGSF